MKLAINGGPKIRKDLFPSQDTYDENELAMINEVFMEGRPSGFRGNWCDEFHGGPQVQSLEKEFAEKFHVKHCISVNSATSGLIVACGTVGLQSQDEVIVTPYSMTCSATAPMWYGAIPVFADIESDFFCLDPDSIEERITPRTKAIIVVDLFGQPYDMRINEIAEKNNLFIIEDAAQAPGSYYEGLSVKQQGTIVTSDKMYAGTIGDIGIFSFNFGKHMTCGEGGMILTNNDYLAMRCKLIRNHAEAVIHGLSRKDEKSYQFHKNNFDFNNNMLGMNLRMTEFEAAIMRAQLKKFDSLVDIRLENVKHLESMLMDIPCIIETDTREGCTHTYYAHPFLFDSKRCDGIHRDKFIEAVKAELMPRKTRDGEGVQMGCGYIEPLYLMPLFQRFDHQSLCDTRITLEQNQNMVQNYKRGSCPTCEKLSYETLFLHLLHSPNSTKEDMKDVAKAFHKVWENRTELL